MQITRGTSSHGVKRKLRPSAMPEPLTSQPNHLLTQVCSAMVRGLSPPREVSSRPNDLHHMLPHASRFGGSLVHECRLSPFRGVSSCQSCSIQSLVHILSGSRLETSQGGLHLRKGPRLVWCGHFVLWLMPLSYHFAMLPWSDRHFADHG